MSTARSINKMTPSEYLEWERQQVERHEYYGGEVFSQAGGTRRHSMIGMNTGAAVRNLIADRDCVVHGSDMRVHIEATGDYVYPDVSVVCPPFEGESDDVISNPVLIAEVLSPSTADYDRGTKFGYYRQIPSLKDYLVISQDEPRVEHHYLEADVWSLRDVVGIDEVLHLASLQCDLPCAEIYAKANFDSE